MVEDGSEAALHRAGGDDAEDVPPARGDVPHGEAAPAVARAGSAAGVTEAGTELVRLRSGGAPAPAWSQARVALTGRDWAPTWL